MQFKKDQNDLYNKKIRDYLHGHRQKRDELVQKCPMCAEEIRKCFSDLEAVCLEMAVIASCGMLELDEDLAKLADENSAE